MATVFLGLGSNLGDRETNIRQAIRELERESDIRVVKESSLYETAPVGMTDQPDFINAVIEVETDLSPDELLQEILEVENKFGRVRNFNWGPRVIDIDVLVYDDIVINTPKLTIPHPRMTKRAFVMIPFAEIAPDWKLTNGKTAKEIADELKEQKAQRVTQVI